MLRNDSSLMDHSLFRLNSPLITQDTLTYFINWKGILRASDHILSSYVIYNIGACACILFIYLFSNPSELLLGITPSRKQRQHLSGVNTDF